MLSSAWSHHCPLSVGVSCLQLLLDKKKKSSDVQRGQNCTLCFCVEVEPRALSKLSSCSGPWTCPSPVAYLELWSLSSSKFLYWFGKPMILFSSSALREAPGLPEERTKVLSTLLSLSPPPPTLSLPPSPS